MRGKKNGGITISMYNVGGTGRAVQQRRQVVILQDLTTLMDSDCNAVYGLLLVMWGSLINIMLLM